MFVWSETYGNASYYSMKNDLSLFRVPCELADSMTLPMINILSFLEYHHILAHLERIHRGLKTAAFAPYNSANSCLANVGMCYLETFVTCDSDHLAAPHPRLHNQCRLSDYILQS
jgi:hypothetical protein